MPQKNLVIYCDESASKGRYYSHFYGGAMVPESHRRLVEARLNAVKQDQGLGAELKWTKISETWADRYIAFIDEVFDCMEEGILRLRIMFTQNSNRPTGLSDYQLENQYFLLYYQLIKHAFGLMHSHQPDTTRRVTILLDEMPSHPDNVSSFKSYLASLSDFPNFRAAGVSIPRDGIAAVSSHQHVILQALDIVMGAMQFRLNDMHLEKPPGKFRELYISLPFLTFRLPFRLFDLVPHLGSGDSLVLRAIGEDAAGNRVEGFQNLSHAIRAL